MKLYFSSGDYYHFEEVRKVLRLQKKVIDNIKMLVIEVDKPFDGEDYGYNDKNIRTFYLSSRRGENLHNNLEKFPVDVHVLLPKDVKDHDIKTLSQLNHIAWASLYNNKRDAKVIVEKLPYPFIDHRFTPLYLSSDEQDNFFEPRKVLQGIHCIIDGKKMLHVEINKPLDGKKYGYGKDDLRTLYLESKHEGNELGDLKTFPIDVSLLVPEKLETFEINSPPPLKVIASARLYNNEEDARNHL